ncbi:MAG: S-layer homology domain-containing protein [Candidatus Altimarinota bacterium]
MKKLLIVLGLLSCSVFAVPVFATSGACSSHQGVDCSAGPDSDGSVICVDGWLNSSVSYSSIAKCKGTNLPSVVMPEIPEVMVNDEGTYSENEFIDVSSGTKYNLAIISLKEAGIISGYEDGSFKPANKINRAEFVKILIAAKFGEPGEDQNNNCFSDVKTGQWYTKYVCKAKAEGIVGGYSDGTFRAEQKINYAEALKLILEANGKVDVATEGEFWYDKYVDSAKINAIYINEISVDQEINRGEMAELMFRVRN